MPSKNPLKDLEVAYRHTFGNEMAKSVLSDLRIYCHATKTTYAGDRDAMLINEGRRQVFYHIMNLLKYDFSDIYNLEENH